MSYTSSIFWSVVQNENFKKNLITWLIKDEYVI